MGSSIFVTGSAGFIGSHLVDALLREGHRVVGVDDFNDYYDPSYKRENAEIQKDNNAYTLLEGDIRDATFLDEAVHGQSISHIIHIAARAGVRASIADPNLYYTTNVIGTLNIFELARKHEIPNVIFASSSSVYGDQKKTPFSEIDPVDHPISPYAASKKACELLAHTYHHLYSLNCIGLRFFTVYGERGRPDMAPYLFTEAINRGKPIMRFGDGSSQRDYTYIDDIISGVMAALDKTFGYDIINLGNSQTVALSRFISTIESILKKKAVIEEKPMQPGDVTITYADVSKAKKLLNYQPTTSIEEGMERFIHWYKNNRV